MITKGIIEELISPYEVKVRIPTLDRSRTSSLATSTENLNTATVCSLPNCYINLQVGDVVFVAFEDNTYHEAVILGHLSREGATMPYADITFGKLISNEMAKLPENTTIGNVTAIELKHLEGIKDNLQKQINNIIDRLDLIDSILESDNNSTTEGEN